MGRGPAAERLTGLVSITWNEIRVEPITISQLKRGHQWVRNNVPADQELTPDQKLIVALYEEAMPRLQQIGRTVDMYDDVPEEKNP